MSKQQPENYGKNDAKGNPPQHGQKPGHKDDMKQPGSCSSGDMYKGGGGCGSGNKGGCS